MKSGELVDMGDQWIEVLEVSTKILSRVLCSAQVCFGHEWRRPRMDDISTWDMMGEGDPSRFSGRWNSLLDSRDKVFSLATLFVIV